VPQPTFISAAIFFAMAFTGAVVLGLCAWQYWQVRDAGKPPKDE